MNENKTTQSPWGGWLLHAVIGTGLTAVLAWLAAPPVAVVVAVLAVGVAHEIGAGDFPRVHGRPGDGVLQLGAVLPAAIVLGVTHSLTLRRPIVHGAHCGTDCGTTALSPRPGQPGHELSEAYRSASCPASRAGGPPELGPPGHRRLPPTAHSNAAANATSPPSHAQ